MIRKLISRARTYLFAPVLQQLSDLQKGTPRPTAIEQKTFIAVYRQSYEQNRRSPFALKDVGFRIHSQHEEDGILLFIFALIGTTNKKCVELCAGDGIECNTANLILNHRWIGLLCDGDTMNVETAERYYSSHPDTRYWPPRIVRSWITRDNVPGIIQDNGFSGEIDLLSLDMDGVDYWIWKAVDCISPRVVVLEFNHLWGPDISVSVPYRDDFVAEFTQYGSDYAGASLSAFVKLGKQKGYRLIGTNAIATNAFFVRNDIHCDWLPEIDPATCFYHPRARFGMLHRLPGVRDKDWVQV